LVALLIVKVFWVTAVNTKITGVELVVVKIPLAALVAVTVQLPTSCMVSVEPRIRQPSPEVLKLSDPVPEPPVTSRITGEPATCEVKPLLMASSSCATANTSTLALDLNLPSSVVTSITALPGAIGVTKPFNTVATAELLVCQVSFLFVAFEGLTVAVIELADPPATNFIAVDDKETPVTGTTGVFEIKVADTSKVSYGVTQHVVAFA
jgi:hypothetical protein